MRSAVLLSVGALLLGLPAAAKPTPQGGAAVSLLCSYVRPTAYNLVVTLRPDARRASLRFVPAGNSTSREGSLAVTEDQYLIETKDAAGTLAVVEINRLTGTANTYSLTRNGTVTDVATLQCSRAPPRL